MTAIPRAVIRYEFPPLLNEWKFESLIAITTETFVSFANLPSTFPSQILVIW